MLKILCKKSFTYLMSVHMQRAVIKIQATQQKLVTNLYLLAKSCTGQMNSCSVTNLFIESRFLVLLFTSSQSV